MSAIWGFLDRDGAPVEQADLARMGAALKDGFATGGGIWCEGPMGLGQWQACFTPEDRAERQPLLGRDGELALVTDARLDNRPELAAALDISPAEARPLPDSELILRAYERWGERCPRHLIGDFAFALWDARRGTLFATRSPPSGRALFYAEVPGAFAFASLPRGLFALPRVPRELDEERVAEFLVWLTADERRSFYRGVRRLLPGQVLTVGRDVVRAHDYWQPELRREIRLPRDDDYVAAFDELHERVVADHLRADGPMGLTLSGGLDSSSVAATAAPLLARRGRRLTAYTEVPGEPVDAGQLAPGRYADETPFVRAVAGRYGNIDLELVTTEGRGLLHDADSFFAAAEVPLWGATNRGWIEAIYERARSAGVRALLTGDMGNLTSTWDGSALLPKLLRAGRWPRAVAEARAWARQSPGRSAARILAGHGVRPLLPTSIVAAGERLRGRVDMRYTALPSLVHPDFAATHDLPERVRAFRLRPIRTDSRASRLRILLASSPGDLYTGYRSMFGVDTRMPLADQRLAEFCLALPEEQYLRAGVPRSLIRRAMAGRLPPEILNNRRRGVQSADWFRRREAERHHLLEEVSRFERDDLVRRVLNLPRMRQILERWPSGGAGDVQTLLRYRSALEIALLMGRYLLWFQAGR